MVINLNIKDIGVRYNMKTKKTGIATNTIINPRLERRLENKNKKLKKMNTCRKCNNFNNKSMYCKKYNFRVSTIELGIKCKSYESITKKNSK